MHRQFRCIKKKEKLRDKIDAMELNDCKDLRADVNNNSENTKRIFVDARGLQCPGPIARVFEELDRANYGDIVEVMATDVGFSKDISSWCARMGYNLIGLTSESGVINAQIEKNEKTDIKKECLINSTNSMLTNPLDKKKATMVVFSGDLDKAIASFIIATGAASMGKEVTMFFTFWGLNILRKSSSRVEKNGIEKMFGMMMPKGVDKLKISKMNMGGIGTKLIKLVMKNKNVDDLSFMMSRAQKMGVKFVACSMSMDIMGIKAEELVDGVEIAGVASYLSEAEEGNLNLFI